MRFSISPGCSATFVRSSFFQKTTITDQCQGFPVLKTSMFSIGGKEFGEKDLYLLDDTPDMPPCDGFLGMDFLENHLVYIDYQKKAVYIGDSSQPPESYHVSIPVTRSKGNTPLALVDIQGKTYSLLFDLGSDQQLRLSKNILKNLEKSDFGTRRAEDGLGNLYDNPAYLLAHVNIGGLNVYNVVAGEISESWTVNTTFYSKSNNREELIKDERGGIGRDLLYGKNVLLDAKNDLIFISNDCDKLKAIGYDLSSLKKVPVEQGQMGAIFSVDTDIGVTRFSIDTGSTLTLVRTSFVQNIDIDKLDRHKNLPVFKNSKFEIGERDFGNIDLHFLNITPTIDDIDGLLGMDFLENHIVYIDNENSAVYIGDCQPIPVQNDEK